MDVEVAPGVTNHYDGSTVFTVGTAGKITGTPKTNLAAGFFKEYEIYLTTDGNDKFVSVEIPET